MQNKCICQRPFSEIEIHTDGNVYTCCPDYLKKYPIGNIFSVKSFDEIWYSQKAIDLRKKIFDTDYSFCNIDICNMKIKQEDIDLVERPPYPTLVRYAYDTQCNLKCMICRDHFFLNTEEENKKYDQMIETLFLPILKNAKIMSITSAGEVTASKHSQKLIKKAALMYPDLKFEILTNGFLFNEKFVDELGISDRIERVVVSVHAMKKNTYETIMKGAKHDIVFKNIEWICSLKKNQVVKDVCFIFVAFSLNYKEIPLFIDFSLKNEVHPTVWEYRNHNRTQMDAQFVKYAVWQKTHPQYNDFVRIINDVKSKYKNQCRMPEIFNDLEPIGSFESLKNKIKFMYFRPKIRN